MKRKDIIEFVVGDMEFGGITRSDYDGKRIKMKGGLTGQKVRAVVKKTREKTAETRLLEVIEKSSLETEDVCKNFGICGGCSMLSVPYEKQLEIKKNQVLKLLEDNDVSDFEFEGVVGSPKNHNYRNKMEYTFGDEEKDGPMTLGMHKKGRHIDIVTVDDCLIVDEDFNTILKNTLEFFKKEGLPKYNNKTHTGYLRHLVLRKGENTGEMLVNLVTSSQIDYNLDKYVDMIRSLELKNNKVVGIINTINDSLADAVVPEKVVVLSGRGYFYEKVLGLKFKVSPFSFFQTNTLGAELLYSEARKYAKESIGRSHEIGESQETRDWQKLRSEQETRDEREIRSEQRTRNEREIIFDLYSGTGTIGQIMSDSAKNVFGIEIIEEAVDAANENAKINGLKNCEFIAGDVGEKVKELRDRGISPDLIIVDPPRAGIMSKAVVDIAGFDSENIVYVSCNPKTLAINLSEFEGLGYKVRKVKLVDLYPNTGHVECVVLLSRYIND